MKGSYEWLVGGASEWRSFQERNLELTRLADEVRHKASSGAGGVRCRVVDVWSNGTRMSGTFWTPEPCAPAPLPAVLLCHGWGGIRSGLDLSFARAFARAGFAVLTFDYRSWGASDGPLYAHSEARSNARAQELARASGLPGGSGAGHSAEGLGAHVVRQLVDMDLQVADIEASLMWLLGEPQVDPERVALWGVSQGGGHVLSVAARQRGLVRAVVAMVPSCGDVGAGAPRSEAIRARARREGVARARGLTPLSAPQGLANGGHLEHMDGAPVLEKLVVYRPLDTAHLIRCPLLVVDAAQEEVFDRMRNGAAAFAIASNAAEGCEYVVLPGRHYDAYDEPTFHKEAVRRTVAFLFKHLQRPASARL
jgi:dienelactone hydrolase